MSRILLGVSGGIAAYKALELVRLATGAGHAVRVVQTPASRRFVGEASFAALSGAPVLHSEFQRDPLRGAFPGDPQPAHDPLSHLELVANADVLLIAPATANTIAKLAGGHADNLLCSCALAATCPVVVAPAMNNRMYEHPATQANLRVLAERGVVVVPPASGRLASAGEEGVGRLAEPPELLAASERAIAGAAGAAAAPASPVAREGEAGTGPDERWRGRRVLVTAGGTREPIDSVRYVGNRSSGRMGLALASAATARGASVTLVAANVALPTPAGVRRIDVGTAAELQAACEREFPACDVLLMAAAVADFAPAHTAAGKLKKAGRERLELVLEPTQDVLRGLASARRPGQTVVGFAAEHGGDGGRDPVEVAREKLTGKGLDALVVNDVSRPGIGFDADENEVTVLLASSNGRGTARVPLPRAAKREVAGAILDALGPALGSG
jgi:phosphopantothenoylcysteine decarboxylase / phosphopantothenate---cysteine ligase